MEPTQTPIEQLALKATRWIGSIQSLVVHTILFVGSFVIVLLGVSLDRVLLVLTTVVSLEAIYLAIFIQMSVNRSELRLNAVSEDVEEIQEGVEQIEKDVDEIQEDIEGISENVEEIQEDIDEIQEDVEQIEKDVDEIQEDMDEIQEEIEEINDDEPKSNKVKETPKKHT
jgi:methyl-accepting chemotaxis protein